MKCSETGLMIKYEYGDFLYFKLLTTVPFATAVIGIYQNADNLWWLGGYLAVIAWHVNLTYRIFCTKCPHYKHEGNTTKCIMIWGVPKFYKPDPRPPSILVTSIIIADILLASVYPLYWLWADKRLLIIYVLAWLVFVVSLLKNECSRCTWFDCAKNKVPQNVREKFLTAQKIEVPHAVGGHCSKQCADSANAA